MTSAEEFNCILCKETFDNKDELQIHFRKHGDPKFNESIKTKSRVQNEAPFASEKSNDASEMVNCDVCDEVFPTISKAITHKHKVHPEHDAKYFCPWCGKLFTMKHLYNKHLHTNHDATDEVPGSKDSHFHCDSCCVYFVAPSALVYHNKFFHRQDTDLPVIGHSKKQMLVIQDLLPVYYCSFCGEEYINKVNLHKHMCDDHGDENQRPTDVLRCPLCEAVFYHLDAYELHLTFHSSEDLYSETNEMNENEITEFSLETVPPVMERIEDLNSFPDVQTDMNAVGIESFLQMAMDEPKDQLPEKRSKKHKKHKKSKKPAITLDEFLSMNQDVFGEDLDFQGIEEVPTKVITKQLKVKKTPIPKSGAKHVSSVDLLKLQKLGIAVKVPSSHKPQFTKVKPVGQPIKVNPQFKNIVKQAKTNAISASTDVLSKLLNQSNSQLKIVKKSAQDKAPDGELDHTEITPNQLTADSTGAPDSMETNRRNEGKGDDYSISKTSPTNNQEINDKEPLMTVDDRINEIVNKQCTNADSNESDNTCVRQIKLPNVSNNVNNTIKHIGKHITIKPITQSATCIAEQTANTAMSEVNETDGTNCPSNELLGQCVTTNCQKSNDPQKDNTLETLRNVNSTITMKSLKVSNVSETDKNSTNDKTDAMYKHRTYHNAENSPAQRLKLEASDENVNKELSVHKTSPAQVLQNINKNITIKSMSPLIKHSIDVPIDEHDSDYDIPEDDTLIEHQSNNRGDKVKDQSVLNPTSSHVLKNIGKNITIKSMSPLPKLSKDVPNAEYNDSDIDDSENVTSKESKNKDDHIKEQSGHRTSNSEVIKNISKNITIKSITLLAKRPQDDVPSDEHNDNDFDLPEDDTLIEHQRDNEDTKVKTFTKPSSSDVLKNIGKNITIKPMSPVMKNPKDVPGDNHDASDFENHQSNMSMENKSKSAIFKDHPVPASSSSHWNINKNVTKKAGSPMNIQIKANSALDENNDSEFDHFKDEQHIETQTNNSLALNRLKNSNTTHKSNVKIKTDQSAQSPYVATCAKNQEFKKTDIQSSNHLLKNLKNITAKPVLTNKSVSQQVTVNSNNKSSAIKQESFIKKSMHTKEISQDIEIYNIDDSDDEDEQQNTNKEEPIPMKKEGNPIKKEPIKANINSPAVLNAIKNMSKHITVKPPTNKTSIKEVKREECFPEQFSDEDEMHDEGEYGYNDDFEQMLDTSQKPTLIKKDTKNKNDYYNNVLKQLGQHVTVKSKNAFNQSIKSINHSSQDFNQGNTEHDNDSDEESYPGKVKITEMTEDDEDIDHTNDCNNEGIVTQSPEDSNSGDKQFTKGREDMDECSGQNIKFNLNESLKPNSQSLLKNISKNIIVKSLSERTVDTSENGSITNQSSLCKELLIKPVKQNKPEITNDSEIARISNIPNTNRNYGAGTSSPSSPNVKPKLTKTGAVNTVNKAVNVKTFQSETVIEEITTTVTKTIRRVNQTTVNQQVFNASKVSPAPRMVKPNTGPRIPNIYTSNNLKGLTVRQPNPRAVRPNIRPVSVRPPSSTVVRASVSNQLVPIRPGVTPIRPMNTPRMPVKPRQPKPVGRPLKISANVVNQTLKRPGNEDTQGHFSCFKKPKESLIPGNETAETSSNFQYASSSQTSKFYSTSQTVKGNSVVTSTQMKAQTVTQQQQISRLGNISGLKVAKTCQVSQMEKTEMNPSKRTALEAIEKLQKQGLLIKKPRIEEDPDPPNFDSDQNEQFNDYDE